MIERSVRLNAFFLVALGLATIYFMGIDYSSLFVRSIGFAMGILVEPWFLLPLLAWAAITRNVLFIFPSLAAFAIILLVLQSSAKGLAAVGIDFDWLPAIGGALIASALGVIGVQMVVAGLDHIRSRR